MIVNPESGQKSNITLSNLIDKIKKYFKKYKMNLSIVMTEYPGHATEIAEEYSKSNEYDVIIGAGGDGTINEVLNGMINSEKPIALMPWGTGNVFAREMNIPFNLKKLVKMIKKGKSLKLDIGRCNSSLFFLMCSAGFDAYSIKETEKLNIKKVVGKLAYIIGGLKAFTKYNFSEIEVRLDDGTVDSGSFVLISNTARYAMYFTVTPDANPIDGLLDVYVFRHSGKWNLLMLIIHVLRTAFSKKARENHTIFLFKQSFYRTKSLELISNGRVFTQLDGDLNTSLPVEISVIPQAINFILPSKIVKKYIKYLK